MTAERHNWQPENFRDYLPEQEGERECVPLYEDEFSDVPRFDDPPLAPTEASLEEEQPKLTRKERRRLRREGQPFEAEDEPRRVSRFEQFAGQVLSGNIFTRAEVRRQYPYVFFMAFLMFLYIANIFHMQKLHRRHDTLNTELKELRAKSLTMSSIRMMSTRQSEIVKELERRGIPLRESVTPPQVIEK